MRTKDLLVASDEDLERAVAMGVISEFESRLRQFLKSPSNCPVYLSADVRKIRRKYSLTQQDMAEILHVSVKSVMRWEKEGEPIPQPVQMLCCLLDRLGGHFFECLAPMPPIEQMPVWTARSKKNSVADILRSNVNALGPLPSEFNALAVTRLRRALGHTKHSFAQLIEVSQSTIEKWESGAVVPKGPSLRVLKLLWVGGEARIRV